MTALSEIADPSASMVWSALREVLDVSRGADVNELGGALDAVIQVLGADRGFVVLCSGDADVVVHACAEGKPLGPAHREELCRSIVRIARREGRTVAWDALDAPEGSFVDLGLGAALAVPLLGRESEVLGVLYVDVRGDDKCFGPIHQDFVETAAAILATVVDRRRALEAAEQRAERAELAVAGAPVISLHELLDPPSMAGAADAVRTALASGGTVLVLGESGVGKTQLAAALASSMNGRVVRATLGASDDLNTITSELFGHYRGAFSGATSRRRGVVEYADGGVLILDEILNLPMPAQQLLLDFTQFGTYRPLGYEGAEPCRAEVRIIAATNGDLGAAIQDGRFREDLYYRLADHIVRLPPLRERPADIPTVADAVLRRLDPGREWALSLPLRRALIRSARTWSGNIRELASLLRRARGRALANDSDASRLGIEHFADELGAIPESASRDEPADEGFGLRTVTIDDDWRRLQATRAHLDDVESRLLQVALVAEQDNVSALSRRLGVPRTTLLGRMRALGIED